MKQIVKASNDVFIRLERFADNLNNQNNDRVGKDDAEQKLKIQIGECVVIENDQW